MARTRTRTTLQATIHRLVSLALAPAACGGSALLVVSGEAGAPDASATTGEATMQGDESVEGDGVPDWILSDRENETGGESWDVVEARILDALKRSA
jgi:hypothetical protein